MLSQTFYKGRIMHTGNLNFKFTDADQTVKLENLNIPYNHRILIERQISPEDGEVPIDLSSTYRIEDNRPTDAIAGATYTDSANLSWGGGTLSALLFGGADVENGRLSLRGGEPKFAFYNAQNNFDSLNQGCIRITYYPGYDGHPSDNEQVVFCLCENGVNNNNLMSIYHMVNGQLRLHICDSLGGDVINAIILNNWLPEAAFSYEFELNYDLINGVTQLFINGVPVGSLFTDINIRTGKLNLFMIGEFNVTDHRLTNFEVDNLIYFTTPQHTEAYTPGYVVPETGVSPANDLRIVFIMTDTPIRIKAGTGFYKIYSLGCVIPGEVVMSMSKIGTGTADVVIRAYGEIPE